MKNSKALKGVLLLIIATAFLRSNAQFQIGHTDITFIDSTRGNRSVPAHIFYPATDTALNAPLANGVFPVFVFGHGILMEWSVYSNVWNYLVPYGYIVASIGTETTFGADFNAFGIDEAFTARSFEWENAKPASLFYNHVGNMATGGHSMGGSAAILSANKNHHIAAIADLAPSAQSVNTSYSMPDTAATLTIPALIFAATGDGMAPPATHQVPIYDSLKSACKALITITGGSHCQFADPHTLCQNAEAGLGGSASISRSQQHAIINRYLLPWLDYTLKGDASAWNSAASNLTNDNEVTYQLSCSVLGIAEQDNIDSGFKLYPNGASDSWLLETNETWTGSKVEIMDITGKHVKQFWLTNTTTEISIDGSRGIYLLHLWGHGKSTTLRLIK